MAKEDTGSVSAGKPYESIEVTRGYTLDYPIPDRQYRV